jgi:hypothetical protein
MRLSSITQPVAARPPPRPPAPRLRIPDRSHGRCLLLQSHCQGRRRPALTFGLHSPPARTVPAQSAPIFALGGRDPDSSPRLTSTLLLTGHSTRHGYLLNPGSGGGRHPEARLLPSGPAPPDAARQHAVGPDCDRHTPRAAAAAGTASLTANIHPGHGAHELTVLITCGTAQCTGMGRAVSKMGECWMGWWPRASGKEEGVEGKTQRSCGEKAACGGPRTAGAGSRGQTTRPARPHSYM